ncbi:MAG: hypothetical protein AVO39_10145 [delta proteobacterium MLS_D]|nr:MAG: hypothetical protein AVO39_10145 [delta proteobacterium MLS_D]
MNKLKLFDGKNEIEELANNAYKSGWTLGAFSMFLIVRKYFYYEDKLLSCKALDNNELALYLEIKEIISDPCFVDSDEYKNKLCSIVEEIEQKREEREKTEHLINKADKIMRKTIGW